MEIFDMIWEVSSPQMETLVKVAAILVGIRALLECIQICGPFLVRFARSTSAKVKLCEKRFREWTGRIAHARRLYLWRLYLWRNRIEDPQDFENEEHPYLLELSQGPKGRLTEESNIHLARLAILKQLGLAERVYPSEHLSVLEARRS
jgi:hypothetical protein